MLTNNIPSGWEVKKLGDVCHFYNGKAHENSIDENGKYILVNSKFVSTDGNIKKRTNECLFPLVSGDIAIVMSDIPNGKAIAKCFYIESNNKYTLNQRIGCLRAKKDLSKYLYNIIIRNKYFLKFDDGVNQTNLKKDEILGCPILLPPLEEQEVIAGVLGDWDNTLELLDRQIELKQQQKKHLMQILLTGTVRLSTFTTPWYEIKLGDVFQIKKGEQLSKINMLEFGKYPILNGGQDFSGYTDNYNTDKNTITISEGGNSCGFVSYITSEFWCGGHCYTVDTKIDKLFSYQILKFNESNIMKLRVGSGLPNIQKSALEKFKFYIPTDINEQNAIAEVLTAVDDEIALLKQKRELVAQQKKYLMQNLLTGQIRVPIKKDN